jgi:hypothetical protein
MTLLIWRFVGSTPPCNVTTLLLERNCVAYRQPESGTVTVDLLKAFNRINQQDAATSQVYYLSFKYNSTCFGHPHAHHQELQQVR